WKPSQETTDWYKCWADNSNKKGEGSSGNKTSAKPKPVTAIIASWDEDGKPIVAVFLESPAGPSVVLAEYLDNEDLEPNSDE
ncbi:hypothetical protein H0H87_012567, partial [Tephrocybe sp. NHM501043]